MPAKSNKTVDNQTAIIDKVRGGIPLTRALKELGIPYRTHYGWEQRDPVYADLIRDAKQNYRSHIGDEAESQLFKLVKSGHWPAVKFVCETILRKVYGDNQAANVADMDKLRAALAVVPEKEE